MLPRDVQRLEHIAEYCDDIAETIDRFGNDFTVFCTDKAYHMIGTDNSRTKEESSVWKRKRKTVGARQPYLR